MELLQLQYFITAAKTENFSQAARLYSVPTSTVSKSISLLEKELGVKLFNRQSNKLTINESGMKFYEYVSSGLNSITHGVNSLKNFTDEKKISLLVLCSRQIVTDFIGEFKLKYPDITFMINNNSFDFENYDLCICDVRSVPQNFNTISLFKEKYGIAVNTNYFPLSSPINLADVADLKFVMMYTESIIAKDTIRFCKKYGFEPKTDIICEDPLYVRRYVEMGFGITFVPLKSWENMFSEKVHIIDLQDECIGREVVFCYKKSQCSNLCNLFIENFQTYIISKRTLDSTP